MDPSVINEPPQATAFPPTQTRKKLPSLALVWAITAGQAVLWGTLFWFFADYWMMLPVRFRWAGGLGLAGLAAISLIRLLLFYRRYFRIKNERKPK